MIKRILVPTDGSVHAKKALDYACDLAHKYGADVHLVHVISESKLPEGLEEYMKAERIQQEPPERVFLEKVGDRIIQSTETEAKAKGIKNVHSTVLLGDPAEKILDYAKTNGMDMIVIGNRGLGGIKTLFMGSVSNKVCHLAECTCVTVK
jgi:nucleotide-binding universal stress UspA family protein